jgi:hypothetical protein
MKKLKDRRVINIPKEDYDVLKSYCDENTLDMPKWIVKTMIQIINTRCGKYDFEHSPQSDLRGIIQSELLKCKDNPFYLKEKYGFDKEKHPSWMKGSFDKDGKWIENENI